MDLVLLTNKLENASIFNWLFDFALHGAGFSPNWLVLFPKEHYDVVQWVERYFVFSSERRIIFEILITKGIVLDFRQYMRLILY